MKRMTAAALVATLLSSAPALRGQSRPPDSTTAFRAAVDVVTVNVTVTDKARRMVTDLAREDFVVFEDNRPQTVTLFQKVGVPLAVSLLLDSSASMQDNLATAQDAAIRFVHELGPADVASVVDFDSRVEVTQGFTDDHLALERAIRRARAGGATALYNAVYIALRELGRAAVADTVGNLRRQALVVLSDGEDTSSLLTFDEVLETAVRSGTAIYAIRLGGNPLPSKTEQRAQYNLRRFAQQTGGRAFFPLEATDLRDVYREIKDELSSQYLLAYESTNKWRDGHYHRIAVRISRPETLARARPGYYAPSR
jgi:Ca-activated chloride channel family protein